MAHKDYNGEHSAGCFFREEEEGERIVQIHRSVTKTEKTVDGIVESLDEQIKRLVTHLVQKSDPNYVPLPVLKWIVIFLIVFNFCLVFGLSAADRLGKHFVPFITEGETGGVPR